MPQPTTAAPDQGDDPGRQPLRTDAERNRSRIVAAAQRVFAEQGLDAPLTDVARHAGVGIATLYRRYPTREALITGAYARQMADYARSVDAALADPDPWNGFRTLIEQVCAMQAADRGFTDVLTMTFPSARAFEAERSHAYQGFIELIARAKDAGRLRQDFSPEDMVLLLMANAGVVAATGDAVPGAWRRVTAYMIQAFAAGHADTLPPAPAPPALYRAMIRWQSSGQPRRRSS
jgi:AcrR family transcriptional regulator